MIENGQILVGADGFEAMILHPAMVYERDGGVFSRLADSARNQGLIEVWGSLSTRWPLVHRADLASAYRLVLEGGAAGQSYNAAAQEGVRIGEVAAAMARRFGIDVAPRVRSLSEVVAEQGAWAEGPTLDQQMSGRKLMETLGWRPRHTDVLAEIS